MCVEKQLQSINQSRIREICMEVTIQVYRMLVETLKGNVILLQSSLVNVFCIAREKRYWTTLKNSAVAAILERESKCVNWHRDVFDDEESQCGFLWRKYSKVCKFYR